jgi:sugar lactone lactonase YvrE
MSGREIRYDVHRSGGPSYPNLLADVSRGEAERFAIDGSAADVEGRTYVITRYDTWKIAAEYRRGALRLERPHDRRAALAAAGTAA